MTNLNNFFDSIYLIHMPDRTDRLLQVTPEMMKLNSSYTTITPQFHENKFHSFCNTMLNRVDYAFESGEEKILIFEDDVVFKSVDKIIPSIQELPNDWGVFYLGCNLGVNRPIWNKRFSENLHQIGGAWTTHAFALNRKAIDHMYFNYKGYEQSGMFDDFLSKQIEAGILNAFVMNPMVAWQRPDKSDIWGVDADYTQCFIDSEKKLR